MCNWAVGVTIRTMTHMQLFVGADLPQAYFLAPIGAIAALVMATVFYFAVKAKSEGDAEMVRIAAAVREGAMAYLRQQYKVVGIVFLVLVGALFLMSDFVLKLQPWQSMIGVPVAGILSGLCGWFGMKTATFANSRTAAAAKESLNAGLTVAFRSGAVMGLVVVGFALLDVSAWFFVFRAFGDKLGIAPDDLGAMTTVMLSFAMGASTQALFARVGGGIYTKAADVGGDLVGKVEAGIPEDDPRNPATIADNVGDNVGDVAGMGADLYESYYGSILSTMALGAAAAMAMSDLGGGERAALAMKLVVAPMALAGIGILCSILGIFTVRTKENATFADLLRSLGIGVWTASALIAAASFGVLWFIFRGDEAVSGVGVWGSIVSGLVAGLIVARATEYSTSYEHPPTRHIAIQALTGPATVIIGGIAAGMRSTWAALLTITVAIIAAFIFAGGGENFLMGLYGVAIAAVGMLATLGITLATDAYGPIADNAGGNAEMSGQPPHVRERTDMLDSLGNTTAATGKGFAIGSAALTALALFAAYIQVVQVQQTTQGEAFGRPYPARNYQGAQMVGKIDISAPHAIYEGHGKFAVIIPGGGPGNSTVYDGGMIDRARIEDHFLETVKPGMVFQAVLPGGGADEHAHHDHDHEHDHGHDHDHDHPHADNTAAAKSRILSLVGEVPHGDHSHTYTQDIYTARNARVADVLAFYDVSLINPRVLGGLFVGVLLTFLFCSMTMSAVGRAAYAMMSECRRQFGLMRAAFRKGGMSEADIADPTRWPKQVTGENGEVLPDYARCVSISTLGAQREMVVPSLLAILVPLAVGFALGVPGVMGMLAGGLTSGFAVGIYMANAGGAWDNAKKLIESYGKITADKLLDDPATREKLPKEVLGPLMLKAEEFRRIGKGSALVYGKGSDDHKATVVGDTVGDPFKDTSGPSLNILIKLISIVSVVFAGLVVKYGPIVGAWLGLD